MTDVDCQRAGCCCIQGSVLHGGGQDTNALCLWADDSGRREGYEYSAGSGCARLPWHLPSALATSFAAFIRLP